ncbi:MAG: hypothetical protein ABJC09_07150, partial [Terriglobia bacterium]
SSAPDRADGPESERFVPNDAVLQLRLRSQDAALLPAALPLPAIMTGGETSVAAPVAPAAKTVEEPSRPKGSGEFGQRKVTGVDQGVPERVGVAAPPSSAARAIAASYQAADLVHTAAPPTPPALLGVAAPAQDTNPPATGGHQSEAPATSPTAHLQEPVPDPKASQQTLRSVALEFAPDGAGDVRLRVSERAGEIHISLHSHDSALSGRLHEGVQELVGSLSRAGYDTAEAWTRQQGRQNPQQHPQQHPLEDEKLRNRRSTDGEDFGSIFSPVQENHLRSHI